VSEANGGLKRSLLAQGRSRDTRQAIIKAALELWSERGYGTGIDDTTAEEIAARAGVAKATFYLHFARKDDILLEAGWLTAKVFYEDALRALLEGGPAEQVIDAITVKLCRRVERVPRVALRRMLRAQGAAGPRRIDDPDRFGFRRAFAVILLHAQQGGDLPRTVSPDSLGRMFEAQLMAVIHDWAGDEDDTELLATLRERFAILRILGASGHDLGTVLASPVPLGHCLRAIAISADLYDRDPRVRRIVLNARQARSAEVRLWGDARPAGTGGGAGRMRHRLSLAARAFKAQALAAARVPGEAAADVEVFRDLDAPAAAAL
jgi:AcrR family transcriptional regulator